MVNRLVTGIYGLMDRMFGGLPSWIRGRRVAGVVAAVWSIGVGIALWVTLDSLSKEDFDGLNNMLQIPFALPWFLIPVAGFMSYEAAAWLDAGYGWLNGLILFGWIDRRPSEVERREAYLSQLPPPPRPAERNAFLANLPPPPPPEH